MKKISTLFLLMAEFGTGDILVADAAEKYFGISSDKEQKRKASAQDFPIPTYRCGNQKTEWCFSAATLAEHIDKCQKLANERWQTLNESAA